MPNYQDGKIYKITGTTDEGKELIYIGSTTQKLCVRFAGHKKDMKNNRKLSSHQVIICSNCLITLIELFPCSLREELLARERYYFDLYDCVNKVRPIVFKEEIKEIEKQYRNENAIKIKEYRIENRNKIKEYKKQYWIENADKIKEYKKQYWIENADKIKEHQKQYCIENTNKIKEHQKQYRIENANKIKEYRIENADKIKEYNKQYRLRKKQIIIV